MKKLDEPASVDAIKQFLIDSIVLIIEKRKWTQKQAAFELGISQPRMSNLANSKIDNFSTDFLHSKLMHIGGKLEMKVKNV